MKKSASTNTRARILIVCEVVIIALILNSCVTPVYQLYNVHSQNVAIQEERFVFENDTLQITYEFWSKNGGVLAFSIFNKSNKGLYVDWMKSSYISNEKRLKYWSEEWNTSSSGVATTYKLYSYPGTSISPKPVLGTVSSSSSRTVKKERKSFIPPGSYISKSTFTLFPTRFNNYQEAREGWIKSMSKDDSLKVYRSDYANHDTPLRFGNYLSFSFNEDFATEFAVNNKFYIREIIELPQTEFLSTTTDENGLQQSDLYKSSKRFYFEVPGEQSMKSIKSSIY